MTAGTAVVVRVIRRARPTAISLAGMSVHLAGSAEHDGRSAEYEGFIGEVLARARVAGRDRPRVAIVTVGPDAAGHAARLGTRLGELAGDLALSGADASTAGSLQLETRVSAVGEQEPLPAAPFAEVDGIVVGGGRTAAYREALEPHFGELRRQVADGVPYLGCSAGAMVAAERAILGGWRVGGIAVTPESASDDLDELELAPGIGLVDVAIDVHAAQWGTVSRLIAAVEAGVVEGGLAIDERTALIVGDGGLEVAGDGSVWRVLPGESGVVVSTMGA